MTTRPSPATGARRWRAGPTLRLRAVPRSLKTGTARHSRPGWPPVQFDQPAPQSPLYPTELRRSLETGQPREATGKPDQRTARETRAPHWVTGPLRWLTWVVGVNRGVSDLPLGAKS
jgi:hypothetical protein